MCTVKNLVELEECMRKQGPVREVCTRVEDQDYEL